MLKKFLSLIILVSMILHCSSRLGIMSYLYEKRYEIAYGIRLISETPIALCTSDYKFNKGLAIHHQDAETQMPASFLPAYEINLFFQSISSNQLLTPLHLILSTSGECIYSQRLYQSPLLQKFHPPKI
jgi:hypothetical protein